MDIIEKEFNKMLEKDKEYNEFLKQEQKDSDLLWLKIQYEHRKTIKRLKEQGKWKED